MTFMNLHLDSRTPIYQQIIVHFCGALVKGELKPGDRIPSIRDLSAELKVNTNTVQRAYQEMERENLIYTKRGMGYFIMDNDKVITKVTQSVVNQTFSRFIVELRALGLENTQILEKLNSLLGGGTT